MPVAVMKAVLTRSEFLKWLAYFRDKPADANEVQMAVLTSLVSAAMGNKKVKMSDFMITKDRPKNKKSTILLTDDPASSIEAHALPLSEVKSFFGAMATPMK